MEERKNEITDEIENIETITKGMPVKEYIKDLENGLAKYDLEISKLNKGKAVNTKKYDNLVLRLGKWIEVYETIPMYMKRLSFLKPIKKKIRVRLKPHIKKDEASLLRNAYTLNDIVAVYNDEKDRLSKKCIEIEEKIKIIENKKKDIEETKKRVEKLKRNRK